MSAINSRLRARLIVCPVGSGSRGLECGRTHIFIYNWDNCTAQSHYSVSNHCGTLTGFQAMRNAIIAYEREHAHPALRIPPKSADLVRCLCVADDVVAPLIRSQGPASGRRVPSHPCLSSCICCMSKKHGPGLHPQLSYVKESYPIRTTGFRTDTIPPEEVRGGRF